MRAEEEFNSHFYPGPILSNIEKEDKLSKKGRGKVDCDKEKNIRTRLFMKILCPTLSLSFSHVLFVHSNL